MADLSIPTMLLSVGVADASFDVITEPLGAVSERVVIDGTPQQGVARRVMLVRLRDSKVVANVASDTHGHYSVPFLVLSPHVPLAIDHTGQYEAVAAGPVMPVEQ